LQIFHRQIDGLLGQGKASWAPWYFTTVGVDGYIDFASRSEPSSMAHCIDAGRLIKGGYVMETALYFPYMRVPKSVWFNSILLYWDRAGTIMPQQFLRMGEIHPYLHELHAYHLLEYIDPDKVLGSPRKFSDGFLSFIEGADLKRNTRHEYERIHTGKVPWLLLKDLEKRGLAHSHGFLDRNNQTWFDVERTTAMKYMEYLAGALAGSQPGTLPVTDTKASFLSAIGPSVDSTDLRQLRYSLITAALPAPTEIIPIPDLWKFKDDHFDQLKRLRVYIDNALVDVAQLDSLEYREARFAELKAKTADEVAGLIEQMEKRRWPKIALLGVGGVVAALMGTAATLVTGGSALAVGLAIGAGTLSAAAGASTFSDEVKAPHYNARSPFAYAAITSKAFTTK
jgi:hypothetical protein